MIANSLRLFLHTLAVIAIVLALHAFVGCSAAPIKINPLPDVAAVRSSNTETRRHIKQTQEHIENVDQDITKLLLLARAPVRDGAADPVELLLHAQGEIAFAKNAAAQSAKTAALTETRALVAEAQVKTEHDELQRCADENAAMRPIVEQVNKWWGIGGIAYGFVRLGKHLLILAAVIVALGVALFVLSFFFPVVGVAFKAIGPLFGGAIRRVGARKFIGVPR